MKNLAKLNGAKALSRTEQKSINGGFGLQCSVDSDCSSLGCGFECVVMGNFGGVCFKPWSNNC